MPLFGRRRRRDNTPNPNAIFAALDAYLHATTLDESRHILESHQSLLLSEATLAILDTGIAKIAAYQEAAGRDVALLKYRRKLLADAYEQGIPAVWERLQADLEDQIQHQQAALFAVLLGLTPDNPHMSELLNRLEADAHPSRIEMFQTLLIPSIGDTSALQQSPQRIALLRELIRRFEVEGDRQFCALLQELLGVALHRNPLGDRAENMEQAITAFMSALQVITFNDSPYLWAEIQANLGNAYSDRIRGDSAENLESAITAFQSALKIFTHDTYPIEWAETQSNLGLTYENRIKGDRIANIEQSIAAFEAALEVRTRGAFPYQWAATQNNLGLAYWNRIRGDRSANIEQAIAAFVAALGIYTRDSYSYDWARAIHNLGCVYHDRIEGDRSDNIEQSIADFQAALQVYTFAAFPYEWARSQNGLGGAYLSRRQGNESENCRQAIAAFQASLQVYTYEALPYEWASSQNNLGVIHLQSGNMEQAITFFRAALKIRTCEALPLDYRATQENLALAYEYADAYREAHLAYLGVRQVQRDLLALANSSANLSAFIVASADKQFYLRDARVLLREPVRDLPAVAEALEEGRAQNLRATLDLDALDPTMITDYDARRRAEAFLATRDTWRQIQSESVLPLPTGITPTQAHILRGQHSSALNNAHRAFLAARDAIREHDNSDFLVPVPRLHDIAQAIATSDQEPREALVYLAASPEGGLVLIILRDSCGESQLHYLSLPRFTEQDVFNLYESFTSPVDLPNTSPTISGGLGPAQLGCAYDQLQSWGISARDTLWHLPPASGFAVALLSLQDEWQGYPHLLCLLDMPFDQLDTPLFSNDRDKLASAFIDALLRVELERSSFHLGDLGLTDLARELDALGIHRVALVPFGQLAMFPLPAITVTHQGSEQLLGDCFEVTIVPSARALIIAKERATAAEQQRHEGRRTLLTVGNPRPLTYECYNLPFAEAEADSARRIAKACGVPDTDIMHLSLERATRKHVIEGLQRSWYAHLALHGQYRADDPRRSQIILAGDATVPEAERTISLGECLDGRINLVGLRLLVLSACETSIIDVRRAPDEVIGMASAFLQAGAAGVIASLWPVNDQATYLLMSRFINLYLDPQRDWSPARCLAEAQRWLREEATNRVLLTYDPTSRIPQEPDPQPVLTELPAELRQSDPSKEELLAAARIRTLRYTQAGALAYVKSKANRCDPDALPYADPIYWAAFTVTGC